MLAETLVRLSMFIGTDNWRIFCEAVNSEKNKTE